MLNDVSNSEIPVMLNCMLWSVDISIGTKLLFVNSGPKMSDNWCSSQELSYGLLGPLTCHIMRLICDPVALLLL